MTPPLQAAARNPLEGALEGVRLIEASAGTGKTHALVSLYLRLLLERHLELDKILVVTFTTAATDELRARIRGRLVEAVAFLRGERTEIDASLLALLEKTGDHEDMLRRLSDTLARMEEAAVFTIHGFCRRMLQEYAFESGVLFDVTYITEEFSLRREVITDFWRSRCPALDAEALRALRERWETPASLLEGFRKALNLSNPRCLPDELELAALLERDPASGEALRFLI
ncbi:MAG: UvrD-helicase domain-containing protein, partial [Nitrospiraceae bacterium]|nr:UvrD-helicase domain-containing protein [Nitrospiraceae bacterium]